MIISFFYYILIKYFLKNIEEIRVINYFVYHIFDIS
jgi:hypothetical protein